jgi:hypothetical protein
VTVGRVVPDSGDPSPYALTVVMRGLSSETPEEFLEAISRLRSTELRPEVTLEEMPAPQRIAPHALAMTADVVSEGDELATGRFVMLHDPAEPVAWQGTYRIVTFVRAGLESDLGSDPLLGQVGWSWLEDSLALGSAEHVAAGGTVTRVVSESFGALAGPPPTVEIEVRASWTPLGDVRNHLLGWQHLLCTVAGLPPETTDVAHLRKRRAL